MSKTEEAFIISENIYNAMLSASRKAEPLEACGLLGGNDYSASEFYELTNSDASNEHYSMLPEEQFAAVKDMRGKEIEMVAIWHSHPATPPRMSEEDLRLAYAPVVYVIVSLMNPDQPEIKGYTVSDGVPTEIQISIADKKED